jgi:hypothetical protein
LEDSFDTNVPRGTSHGPEVSLPYLGTSLLRSTLPLLIQTIKRLTSVGLIPEILEAKPTVAGWISFSFWRDSFRKPDIRS